MFRHLGTVLLLSAIALSILCPSMLVEASTIVEWTIPTGDSQPREIYVDGNVTYFTEYAGNKIGCLNVSSGLFKEWTVPTANSGPHDIYVSGGLVYFTEYLGNKIGRLNPFSGEFTEWGTYSGPLDIAISGGIIFFTAHIGGAVGRLDPTTNVITYWGSAYYPMHICVSGGLVYWVGVHYYSGGPPSGSWYSHYIYSIDPATNFRTTWDAPAKGSSMVALLYDMSFSGGMLYYTDNGRNLIGRLDVATDIINEWTVPTGNSHPYGIYVSGGKVYFTENTGNKIGCLTIDPCRTVTVFGYPWHYHDSYTPTSTTASSPYLSTSTTAALTNTTTSATASRTASTYSLWDTLVISFIQSATNTTTTTTTTTTTSVSSTTTLSTFTTTETSRVIVPTTVTQLTTQTIAGLEHVTHTVIIVASTTVVSGATVTSVTTATGTITTSLTTSATSTTTTTTTTTTTLTTSTTETYVPALFRRCVIASAAYGSELAPEVQLLRTFRDRFVHSTFAGQAFMRAFNSFYYSFSPAAALTVADSSSLAQIVRLLLYPLIIALQLSSTLFHTFTFSPELGMVFSGISASALIGATYLTPLLAVIRIRRRRGESAAPQQDDRQQ